MLTRKNDTTGSTKGALSSLKVIEINNFIAASYCSKLMADLGAGVIKVERPNGDETRRYGPFPDDVPHSEKSGLFLYLNLNKLGITLDWQSAKGHQILLKLLSQADVLVIDYPPKRLKEYGLEYELLKEINKQLVAVYITPFGLYGPYRDYKAYDIQCSSLGGMSDSVGDPSREPLVLPAFQTHFQSGTHAAVAALIALFARDIIGQGQQIDISESDVWCIFHAPGRIQLYIREGSVRRRGGHRTPGFYPYTVLPCKGGYVNMIAGRGFQWKRFLELVGDGKVPDWYANDPRFKDRLEISRKYADEVDRLLEPWLMEHSKEEIFSLCRERRIPFTPVYNVDEVVNHPHLKAVNYFVEMDRKEVGKLRYPGAPYKLSETPWQARCPAPLLGEHNEQVYCQGLGFSKTDLVQLRQMGVI